MSDPLAAFEGPILVANRGEIAVRIARTARNLGLSTAAVFTEADADALHVESADVAVRIDSYLDGAEVVRAAALAGASAVHPGYGFLSENAEFARSVIASGLIWIGPPPEAIDLMGDKARAKILAREAGVPVVPGLEGEDLQLDQIEAFCVEHGFPAIIKAVAGGGGKGMRVIRTAAEVEPALQAARREALAAFGDSRVLVERYVERPRHIEVQVLADQHGTTLHVGERECSLQRRHQKVVEEAPSPVVGPALRERMGQAAAKLAAACNYVGAGTVEFITAAGGDDFFFLEMNTRLQVEHPVTELVYGVDLVEQQLLVAAGAELQLQQQELVPNGHAVEARLYAEDPAHGFLPSTGTVHVYNEPAADGVRIDSGIRAGSVVGTSYDPMLAKVIARGPDRASAMRRLDRALANMEVVGVTTNAAFTRALLAQADVRRGDQDTGTLERVLESIHCEPPIDLAAAGMLAAAGTATPAGPWRRELDVHGEVRIHDGHVSVGEHHWSACVRPCTAADAVRVTLDGVERRYAVAIGQASVWVARDGYHLELRTRQRRRGADSALAGSLEAPMPGTVLIVATENGAAVQEGDALIVIESMKMELTISAPHAGTVAGLDVKPGDRVSLGQTLLAVVAATAGDADAATAEEADDEQ